MCRCRDSYYSGSYSDNYSRTYIDNNNYETLRYANAYVVPQTLNSTFSPMEGLSNGTMFPELVSPYRPGLSMEEINYLKYDGRGGCR